MSDSIDLSLYDGELRLEDGYLVRRWIDEDGIRREAKAPWRIRMNRRSGCESSQVHDPRAYHREYYRKVRRHRMGRVPVVDEDAPPRVYNHSSP